MAHRPQPEGGYEQTYTRYVHPQWDDGAPWLYCTADMFIDYYLRRMDDGRMPRPNLAEVERAENEAADEIEAEKV